MRQWAAGAQVVRPPVPSLTTILVNAHTSQEVCPFNVRFAEESAEPGYAARGTGELPVGG